MIWKKDSRTWRRFELARKEVELNEGFGIWVRVLEDLRWNEGKFRWVTRRSLIGLRWGLEFGEIWKVFREMMIVGNYLDLES